MRLAGQSIFDLETPHGPAIQQQSLYPRVVERACASAHAQCNVSMMTRSELRI